MRFWIFGCCCFLFFSCSEQKKQPQVEGVQTEAGEDISSIIRNPVSAEGIGDTINVAKIVFEETQHDFGTVKEGDVLKHVFTFENTGKVPLVIADARSTCGCTVPQYPKAPIPAGEKGEISVRFDTKNKPNKQQKPITITANTHPKKTVLQIKADVIPDPNRSEGVAIE